MAFTRQVAKIGMISTLEKRSGDFKIYRKALAKQELTKSSAIADHIKATGHNIAWGHFEILASGNTNYHCKKPCSYMNLTDP